MRISVLPLFVSMIWVALSPAASPAQRSRIGDFEGHGDVGPVHHGGSASYDGARQQYTIAGSGENMWGDHDAFHFVWKRLTGNFILSARGALVGEGGEPHRKLGWIIRSSLDPKSPHVSAVVHGDGLVALQFRRSPGAETEEVRSPVTGADVVQLERKGNTYTMSVARFGDTLTASQVTDVALGDQVYVGLFVCAHTDSLVERATFRDVRITVPAKDDFTPYLDYIGSNIETLDVETGDRRVVYKSADPLQAPNWSKDGKSLIYNSNGRLYRLDLGKRDPVEINTAFATSNNNDHVLSFDGRTLAISHHSAEDQGKSIVYTVPVTGGTPKKVTAEGPSYLHGWSPDGKFLVYTGERGNELDIYRIGIGGGEETRLTSSRGLDDGPEYSPDGQFIFFNSVRSGTMQLWRMRADGSEQTQLTDDSYNNWFPHISPDGTSIVFLSFTKDVSPGDHPFYKQVYLRRMPVGGGPARVIAYVYGGQGTINVPSWSPDGKRVAFVSNTDTK